MKKLVTYILLFGVTVHLLNGGVVFVIEANNQQRIQPRPQSTVISIQGQLLKMEIGTKELILSESDEKLTDSGNIRSNSGEKSPASTMYYNDITKKFVVEDGSEGFSFDSNSFKNWPMDGPEVDTPPPGVPMVLWDKLPADKKSEIKNALINENYEEFDSDSSIKYIPEYVDTGNSGEHPDGTPYKIWRKIENGKLKTEFKVFDWKDIPEGPDIENVFSGFTEFINGMLDPGMRGYGISSGGENIINDFEKINGIPFEGIEYENDRITGGFTITILAERILTVEEMLPDPLTPIRDTGAMMEQTEAELVDFYNQLEEKE